MQTVTEIPKLTERKSDSHKGTFGRVCIIGGQIGMSGAPALAATAALVSGAGLVRVAVAKSILNTVASYQPCYTTIPLRETKTGSVSAKAIDTILTACEDNDVIAIGPGIGTEKGPRQIINTLIAQDGLRLVIDADGLNCLSKEIGWTERKKASIILTPHPGEMARLWKSLLRKETPTDRSTQASMLAEKSGCTVVLKGAGTVVADSEKVYVNTTGNPAMATAGSGDVLTGVIAALAGQGLCDFDAAVLGVYTHGLAGDIAAKKRGEISMIATDIIKKLPKAFKHSS